MKNILIVDDQPAAREVLSVYVESFSEKAPICCSSVAEAKQVMIERDGDIDLIISDYNMPNSSGWDLYTYKHDLDKSLPFILVTAESREDLNTRGEFLETNDHFDFIRKPFYGHEICESLELFFPKKDSSEAKFMSLEIDYFLKYQKEEISCYIKLTKGKILKVSDGDAFSKEVLLKYKSKGIERVYILKTDFHSFMESKLESLHSQLSSQKGTDESSVGIQSVTVETVTDFLRTIGIRDSHVEVAQSSVELTLRLVRNKKGLNSIFKQLRQEENVRSSISVLSSYISALLGSSADFCDHKCLEKLGMASFFQDVAIKDDELCLINDKNDPDFLKLSKENQSVVLMHPLRSAEMLEKLEDLPTDIINLIKHHHESPCSGGFPRGEGGNKLGVIFCVFILSVEFAHFLLKNGLDEENVLLFKDDIEQRYTSGNYSKARELFMDVF
ncbi:hypothetical protein A9Q84_14880 [Halobacteriovorax marinus]|uniref:Response regulatory domain-containing protein n=1 Tax=Halobacteriovorax marinus TaxID=97084 RepID=A0A1Y5FAK3_9BACT|nr:hypothetical protein A9Q84_14880 [Halobacteriovorax marinus]